MGKLNGKIIIVTGASSGIGEATALKLAEEGATVIATARRKERLSALAERNSNIKFVTADLTKPDQITALVKQVERVDVLINIAGWGRYKWFDELTAQELRQQYEVGVLGLAELTRQIVGIMKKQKSGHIINMASYASRVAFPPQTVYASTKYAVEGLSDGLRRELAPWGIKVTRIHPGGVYGTEFNQRASENGGIKFSTASNPFTRTSKDNVASKIVDVILNPTREVFIVRIYDLAVFANRHFTSVVDWVSKWWVKRLWKK
jgi:uncharacterized protein